MRHAPRSTLHVPRATLHAPCATRHAPCFAPCRVSWITFNEPANHVVYGLARGEHAPGRSRKQTREPYVAAHYILLAHAYAVAHREWSNEMQPPEKQIKGLVLWSPAIFGPFKLMKEQLAKYFGLAGKAMKQAKVEEPFPKKGAQKGCC